MLMNGRQHSPTPCCPGKSQCCLLAENHSGTMLRCGYVGLNLSLTGEERWPRRRAGERRAQDARAA